MGFRAYGFRTLLTITSNIPNTVSCSNRILTHHHPRPATSHKPGQVDETCSGSPQYFPSPINEFSMSDSTRKHWIAQYGYGSPPDRLTPRPIPKTDAPTWSWTDHLINADSACAHTGLGLTHGCTASLRQATRHMLIGVSKVRISIRLLQTRSPEPH